MRGGPHNLADRLTQRRFGKVGRRLGRLPDGRELHYGVGPQFEVRAGRRNRDVVVIVGERHRAGLEPAHDVGREASRNDARSVLDTDHLFGDLDREIEIRSCDRKHISRAREKKPGQHRGGGGACTYGTTSRGQHVDQCISLGSELHRSLSFRPCPQSPLSEEERNVCSKGNKGCGLWMTVTRSLVNGCNPVPMAVWVTAPIPRRVFGPPRLWGRATTLSPAREGCPQLLRPVPRGAHVPARTC